MTQRRLGHGSGTAQGWAPFGQFSRARTRATMSGSRVVQEWFNGGSKVVQKWFRHGSRIAQYCFLHVSGKAVRPIPIGRLRGWFQTDRGMLNR
eukprot:1340271-Pyramimonas_sp.AAC.1